MKNYILLLLGAVITITGFSACAAFTGQETKKSRMRMHRHMRQPDEIDKLLMLVNIQERMQKFKMQAGKNKERTHQKIAGKGMKGQTRHKMMGKNVKGQTGKSYRMSRHHGGQYRKHGLYSYIVLKAYLLKNYSKEINALAEQKKNNDKAAKETLEKAAKLVKEAKAKMKAEHEQFVKMIADYKKSKDEKLASQIKAKLSELYDMRIEKMKKKIDEDASRVKKAYEELEKKKAGKDKDISERFEKITG